jgi:hypothetical protein
MPRKRGFDAVEFSFDNIDVSVTFKSINYQMQPFAEAVMKKFFGAIVFLAAILSLQAGCGGQGAESHGVPNAFSFAPRTDALLNALIESDEQPIDGINVPVSIHVQGGEYSIDGGAYTSSDGTVVNGERVRVRHATSATPNTETVTVLTVGGMTVRFTSTTGMVAADTIPEPFSSDPQIGVAASALVLWPEFTLGGINTSVPIRISGGGAPMYSIDGGPFTGNAGMVRGGQKIIVRHRSSASPGGTTISTLTIGGVAGLGAVTGTFSSTTAGTEHGFTSHEGVAPNSMIESNSLIVPGAATPVPISVTTGEYSINGSDFTSASGLVSGGQTVKVRHISSAVYGTQVTTVLTIGERTYSFTSVTMQAPADTVPDKFSFDPPLMLGVAVSTEVVSSSVTVLGIDAPAEIQVLGGGYSIDGGDFTTETGTVRAGQTVRVRHVSAGTPGTTVTTTLRIGGVAAAFTSRTLD